MSGRGKFITLEGLEGVGKTSNRQRIEQLLTRAGIDFVGTREPGGTPVGEKLRDLVLHADGIMQPETELLLMAASRLEHVAQLIEPALSRGQWVLCDRYLDASVAYQGAGRQLGTDRVVQLHSSMGLTLQPDLTVLLDMPVEAGLARMAARGKPDRIESETVAFFERARDAYLKRAQADPARFNVVDASRTLDEVCNDVSAAVQSLIDSTRQATCKP
ncbi:MAG: dTMP kinase [Granulosicoccus sp.]